MSTSTGTSRVNSSNSVKVQFDPDAAGEGK